MSDINNMLTGVIESADKNVLFVALNDRFLFCFLSDCVRDPRKPTDTITMKSEGGFVYGRTHDNHIIAIYVGDEDLIVRGNQWVHVSAYIVSTGNIEPSGFDGYTSISFSGGSMSNVFRANRLDFSPSFTTNSVATMSDDKLSFMVETSDGIVDLEVQSGLSFSCNNEGNVIRNCDITLELSFETPQTPQSIFKYYRVVKNTLSFMCFRKDIGFDSIRISRKSEDSLMPPNDIGDVYINNDGGASIKDWQINLCIEDLGDSFPALFGLFYNEDGRVNDKLFSTPLIGFIPNNEKDYSIMSASRIRDLCTSIELEYSYIDDIRVQDKTMLKELQEDVIECMELFKENHKEFPGSSFDSLKSSVDRWTLSLRDRVTSIYEKYKDELSIMLPAGVTVTSNDVGRVVRFRNTSTHDKGYELTPHISTTAFYMQALVYFCVLERIGVSRDDIKRICRFKLLR